ncbi:hypothetical protein [Ruminococcus sp.]
MGFCRLSANCVSVGSPTKKLPPNFYAIMPILPLCGSVAVR